MRGDNGHRPGTSGAPGAEDVGATYGASEAAALAGVSRQCLITWERRYGFPSPARNANGYRRYSAEEVLAVSRVRASVDAGMSVPTAIAALETAPSSAQPLQHALAGSLSLNALDSLPVPVAVLRAPDFRYVYVNPALRRAVKGARLGARVEDVLDAEGIVSALRQVVNTGRPWQQSEEPIVIDGELRYISATYLRLFPLPGQPHHVFGIAWDKTQEVRAKRGLARWRIAMGVDGSGDDPDRGLLATLRRISSEARSGSRLLAVLAERVCEGLDADGVAVAALRDDALVPVPRARVDRGVRWKPIALRQAPLLASALRHDRIVSLDRDRTPGSAERDVCSRLVARTLCCAPIRAADRAAGAILVRWSLASHDVSDAEADFLDVVRELAGLVTELHRRPARAG